jgi:hypothetical protein
MRTFFQAQGVRGKQNSACCGHQRTILDGEVYGDFLGFAGFLAPLALARLAQRL